MRARAQARAGRRPRRARRAVAGDARAGGRPRRPTGPSAAAAPRLRAARSRPSDRRRDGLRRSRNWWNWRTRREPPRRGGRRRARAPPRLGEVGADVVGAASPGRPPGRRGSRDNRRDRAGRRRACCGLAPRSAASMSRKASDRRARAALSFRGSSAAAARAGSSPSSRAAPDRRRITSATMPP